MNRKAMLDVVQRITDLASKLRYPPNMVTPEIVQCCINLRFMINFDEEDAPTPGQTARGTKMPQRPEEWAYLGALYEKGLMRAQEENSQLRIQINKQAQRLEKQRRTINGMLETPDEF